MPRGCPGPRRGRGCRRGVAHPLLPPGVAGCPCRRVSRRCPSAARGASQALRRSASGPAGECLIAAGPRASPVSCLPPAEQPAAGTAPAFLPAAVEGAQQPDEKRWVVTALPRSRHTPRDTALVPKSAVGRCGNSGDTAALRLAGGRGSCPLPSRWIGPCLAVQHPARGGGARGEEGARGVGRGREGWGGGRGGTVSPKHRGCTPRSRLGALARHRRSIVFVGLRPATLSHPRVPSPRKETGNFFDQIHLPFLVV